MDEAIARDLARRLRENPDLVDDLGLWTLWVFCRWNDPDGDWSAEDMREALRVCGREKLLATVRENVLSMVD